VAPVQGISVLARFRKEQLDIAPLDIDAQHLAQIGRSDRAVELGVTGGTEKPRHTTGSMSTCEWRQAMRGGIYAKIAGLAPDSSNIRVAGVARIIGELEAKMGRSILAFVVLLSACVSLSAQWLHYPTPGIPRTPDGKPNLSAPAPKTPDGKPDLSGIWNIQDNPGQTQFLDIAPSVQGGLPYRPGIAELTKARSAPPKTSEPITRCLPIGIVERHTWIGGLKKIVHIPGLLLILNEYNTSFRQIFTDGGLLPTIDQFGWHGYSIGKWEGGTLIVEAAGLRGGQ